MSEGSIYRFGEYTLDTRAASLRHGERPLPLRPKSYDVLLYLVRNPGRLISKDELFTVVWGNIAVTENSLVQCISDIRQALGDADAQIVKTISKRGYMFAPPSPQVSAIATPAEPAPPPPASRSRVWLTGAAVAAIGALAVVWWTARPIPPVSKAVETAERAASTNRLSIAVLPFTRGDDAATDYFSTGITEDIATALGRFPELAVVTPDLVARLAHAGQVANIPRQLKVNYLVEGTLRRSNDRIRIAVRLNEAAGGLLLWSESYDAPGSSIAAIEDDIAIRIAGALAVKLTDLEQKRAASKTGNLEAYDLVLRGRDLLSRLNRTSFSEARKLLERAIELDPNYAAAYIGLGKADLGAVAQGWTASAEDALKRAEALARKAISLDEFDPAAHALLGRIYARLGDDRAVSVLKRAVALNPSNAESHAALGDALLWSGDTGAAVHSLETAVAMDPRRSAEDLFSLGAAYFIENRTNDSLIIFERATARNEGNPFIFAMLAALYTENGREPEARSAAAEVRRLNPFFDARNFGTLFKREQERDRMANALRKAGF